MTHVTHLSQPSALRTGRSPNVVALPTRVGRTLPQHHAAMVNRWTSAQLQYLRAHYTDCTQSVHTLATALNKSIQAVRNRAARLGIYRITRNSCGPCQDPIMAQLRARRLARNIHTKALARILGITQDYLTSVERGRGTPKLSLLHAWCKALGLAVVLAPADTYAPVPVASISQPASNPAPAVQSAIDTPSGV